MTATPLGCGMTTNQDDGSELLQDWSVPLATRTTRGHGLLLLSNDVFFLPYSDEYIDQLRLGVLLYAVRPKPRLLPGSERTVEHSTSCV